MSIQRSEFGVTAHGVTVHQFILKNRHQTEVCIINYGGIITSLYTPDRDGNRGNIVLGFDEMSGYLERHPYFGSLVGRYGNRIAGGRFTLDGKEYQLSVNDGKNHLHGGFEGLDRKVWEAEITEDNRLKLTCTSPDGEEGFPGTLKVEVHYTLTDENELHIDYSAVTDQPTPVNLTGHTYFNLWGDPSKKILDHSLKLSAEQYTPAGPDMIPTGEIRHVADTPFDFTGSKLIGEEIASVECGYDHNYVMPGPYGSLKEMAHAFVPENGRELTVLSTEPGFQFYTGNFLDGTFTSPEGVPYRKHVGFCIEPQHFPDSPNKESFPSVILRPGEEYRSKTVYRFGVRGED